MKRQKAIELYNSIRDVRSARLDRETMIRYIKLRLKLREIHEQFQIAHQEISEQTKPANWQEGDDLSDWNNAFHPIFTDYMNEEIEIDTKILTQEQAIDLVMANAELPGSVGDLIISVLSE